LIFATVFSHTCNSSSISSIENRLQNVHIPGLAAIVVNSTNILYEERFGYQSPISNQYPIDPSKSVFVLASLSKIFIALAAMQLVEKSLLNLDTDVNQYLKFPMRIFYPIHLVWVQIMKKNSIMVCREMIFLRQT
jgi:CubicO group peptidase (beta-lactamase class C family)